MSTRNPQVDFFFQKDTKWQEAFLALRKIMSACGLTETLKWGVPCYTLDKHNIVLMHGFKDYCALLFFKGALLKDPDGVLVQQTKNVQAARQLRFTGAEEIADLTPNIKTFIREAIKLEKSGIKVALKKTAEWEIPEEFEQKLKDHPALKAAFQALTPGRQRGYLLHFSSPRLAKTREARMEKIIPQILEGKGLNDV